MKSRLASTVRGPDAAMVPPTIRGERLTTTPRVSRDDSKARGMLDRNRGKRPAGRGGYR